MSWRVRLQATALAVGALAIVAAIVALGWLVVAMAVALALTLGALFFVVWLGCYAVALLRRPAQRGGFA